MSGELLPILPVRDAILFPGTIAGICAGKPLAISAIKYANCFTNGRLVILAQKEQDDRNIKAEDLYSIGTLAEVSHVVILPDDSCKCTLTVYQSIEAQNIKTSITQDGSEVLLCTPAPIADASSTPDEEFEIKKISEYIFKKLEADSDVHKMSDETMERLRHIKGAERLIYAICSNLPLKFHERQEILEEKTILAKLDLVYKFLNDNLIAIATTADIRSKVRSRLDKIQKDCYLNEQLKIIQKELGTSKAYDEMTALQKKIEALPLPPAVRKKALYELDKLKNSGQFSVESSALRTYLDWMVKIPWGKYSKTNSDLGNAEKALSTTHYGLNKPKERILEYIAVHKKSSGMHGAVLCLNGLEGTGKSSIAKSIAKAMNRSFVRISLGGIRDEADMRGHRRTYVGSMPGRIVQAICKAKCMNPVILLDEMDKIGYDYRGDPAAALLEILDPEQNKAFYDHYMEIDLDISGVFFIATINDPSKLMRPLLDRMEVVSIPSYTEEEKLCIARQHMVPKQKTKHGLKSDALSISSGALTKIIREYTKEPGVRSLERECANICRKVVKKTVESEVVNGSLAQRYRITSSNLMDYCGSPKFLGEKNSENKKIGSVNGLAYTTGGGELMTIEAALIPSTRPRIVHTGSLGDTMKESVRIAYSFARSVLCNKLGVDPNYIASHEVHVHAPAGATPKDGPSAGIAICSAIISAFSERKISGLTAMTGELTLLGDVLRIGGLREKLLAAIREKIKVVIIPKANEFDLQEVPPYVLSKLTVMYVEQMQEVVDIVFKDFNDPKYLIKENQWSKNDIAIV